MAASPSVIVPSRPRWSVSSARTALAGSSEDPPAASRFMKERRASLFVVGTMNGCSAAPGRHCATSWEFWELWMEEGSFVFIRGNFSCLLYLLAVTRWHGSKRRAPTESSRKRSLSLLLTHGIEVFGDFTDDCSRGEAD